MKHPQHIFVFDKSRFPLEPGINRIHVAEFKELAEQSIMLGRRHEMETDERFGQCLPYIVLKSDKGLFTYTRTKLVGEERLAGNHSVGLGGHVDAFDAQFRDKSLIDPLATFAASVGRELNEEVIFISPDGTEYALGMLPQEDRAGFIPQIVGIINDTSNEVGRVHYGILMVVNIPDGWNARCREAELTTVGFVSEPVDGPYENWSTLAIKFFAENSPETP